MAKTLLDFELNDLQEWVENGRSVTMSPEFFQYVDLLDKIRAMHNRKDLYGSKEVIIRHLITFQPELKGNRVKANQLYAESMEYFYTSNIISKQAWRNMYADDLDKAYDLALSLAQTTEDVVKAGSLKERAGKMRALDKDDPQELPKDFFTRPNKLYTLDMDLFEQGNADRKEIELWIDENTKKLTPKAIDRIKQEALIQPIKIFQDEAEDARKD